jgi:hypothetical protein
MREHKKGRVRGARKKRRSIVEQSEKYTLAVRARGVPNTVTLFFYY